MKKETLSWTQERTEAFEKLKVSMSKTPLIATPNFKKTFIVEYDASKNDIGAILMQEGSRISFESFHLKIDVQKLVVECLFLQ